MVNNEPLSLADQLEQAVSKQIRRRLACHLYTCLEIGLSDKITSLKLTPHKLRSTKWLNLLIPHTSLSNKTGIEERSGRKRSVTNAEPEGKSCLQNVILGATSSERDGLCMRQQP